MVGEDDEWIRLKDFAAEAEGGELFNICRISRFSHPKFPREQILPSTPLDSVLMFVRTNPTSPGGPYTIATWIEVWYLHEGVLRVVRVADDVYVRSAI